MSGLIPLAFVLSALSGAHADLAFHAVNCPTNRPALTVRYNGSYPSEQELRAALNANVCDMHVSNVPDDPVEAQRLLNRFAEAHQGTACYGFSAQCDPPEVESCQGFARSGSSPGGPIPTLDRCEVVYAPGGCSKSCCRGIVCQYKRVTPIHSVPGEK